MVPDNHEAYPVCPGYERKRILFDTTGRPDAESELRLPKGGKVVGRALRLSARAPDYQEQERPDVVVLDAATPAEVDFALLPLPSCGRAAKPAEQPTRGRTVSGTVIGPDGKPVASALVRWDLRYGSNDMPETKSDDLAPEAKLSGLVLDEDGRPVAGARLVLTWGRASR